MTLELISASMAIAKAETEKVPQDANTFVCLYLCPEKVHFEENVYKVIQKQIHSATANKYKNVSVVHLKLQNKDLGSMF